jgi:transposase
MATAVTRRATRKGSPNRSIAFKREIASVACTPGVSVARLALERGLNTNLLFKWRRYYRAGKFGPPDPAHLSAAAPALPVLRKATVPTVTLLPVEVSTPKSEAVAAAAIEVVFRSATVRITGKADATLLRVILDTLARHP